MENKGFTSREKVVMVTYPYEEFIYLSDDGKNAEVIDSAGSIHYRRLEFLESPTESSFNILTGTIRTALAPDAKR